jgi:hypothetical protein
LFEKRSLSQKLAGPAPQLDVEIVAFEEVRRDSGRRGRVTLRFALHDEARILVRGTVQKEHAAASEEMPDVVRAIAGALDDASSDVADAVVSSLDEQARGDDVETSSDAPDRSE